MRDISTCIWFADGVEEAAKFYSTVFSNTKLKLTTKFDEPSSIPSGKKPGEVLYMTMDIEGLEFFFLNGGPVFKPNPTMSYFLS